MVAVVIFFYEHNTSDMARVTCGDSGPAEKKKKKNLIQKCDGAGTILAREQNTFVFHVSGLLLLAALPLHPTQGKQSACTEKKKENREIPAHSDRDRPGRRGRLRLNKATAALRKRE